MRIYCYALNQELKLRNRQIKYTTLKCQEERRCLHDEGKCPIIQINNQVCQQLDKVINNF
ncbi:MAG: hypothetical protein ABIJ14_02925 [Nanoarchaeota archaeon]